jgi:hypothetical protein
MRNGDLKQFIRDETAGPDKFVDTFSFRRNHRADSALMRVKDSGEEFGQHDDARENAFAAQFGPPGSGLERCATCDADTPASLKVRDWANRELGHSTILYTVAEKTSGFQFVISDDQDLHHRRGSQG